MATHGRSVRKRTGGRLRPHRDTRKAEEGRQAAETQIGEPRFKIIDAQGRNRKVRALATNEVLLADDGETYASEITSVIENPANPNYVRRNIVTKGALIETPDGVARVTSRPGQTGQVCAVLVDD